MEQIKGSQEALEQVTKELEAAAADYKANYAKLQNLMGEITSGNIQGDLADDLLAKFEAKDDSFKAIQQSLDTAFDKMKMQTRDFINVMSDTQQGMR